MKKEKEILLWDWDDLLFPGLLSRSIERLWRRDRFIADYSLPSEWDELVWDLWKETDGHQKITSEQNLLLRDHTPDLSLQQTLEELSERWRLFAAGSADRETVDFSLDICSWQGMFEETTSGSDLGQGKPHPEIYLRTLDRAGAVEEDAFVIVGSRRGAEAAFRSETEYLLLATSQISLSDPLARAATEIFWDPQELLAWL